MLFYILIIYEKCMYHNVSFMSYLNFKNVTDIPVTELMGRVVGFVFMFQSLHTKILVS